MSGESCLPNLLIVGVQKGGTTWLHEVLKTHEDVYMTRVKELRYFNRRALVNSPTEWEKYKEHFYDGAGCLYRGESTPHYMWVKSKDCPFSPLYGRRVRKPHDVASAVLWRLGPAVKIIVVLRNPVDRAISAAYHNYSRGRLRCNESLWEAAPRLGIIDLGFYRRHLSRWIDVFGDSQVHVFLYEDIVRDARTFLVNCVEGIGLRCDSTWLCERDLMRRVNSREEVAARYGSGKVKYEGIRPGDRERLAELYAGDMAYVREILGAGVWT